MLFSTLVRTDASPRLHSESCYAHVNRRAGPEYDRVRNQIERWAARLVTPAYAEVQGRLQSGDDNDFDSAFFELYVHELLIKSGHTVVPHPTLLGTTKRPDFLASGSSGDVIVEAKVVTEATNEERARDARLRAFYAAIDERIKSPDYFLSLDVDGACTEPIPFASWCRKLQIWLDGLDYDEIVLIGRRGTFHQLPVLEIEHDDAIFRARPIAKNEAARGKTGARPLGVLGGGAEWVTSHFTIAEALSRKARRYGALTQQFVIAINCLGPYCDWEEVEEGIYGSEGPRSTAPRLSPRVSAVLCGLHVLPWSFTRAEVCLFHNPNATFPYVGPLTSLPQTIRDSGKTTTSKGRHPREWFGLNESWPE